MKMNVIYLGSILIAATLAGYSCKKADITKAEIEYSLVGNWQDNGVKSVLTPLVEGQPSVQSQNGTLGNVLTFKSDNSFVWSFISCMYKGEYSKQKNDLLFKYDHYPSQKATIVQLDNENLTIASAPDTVGEMVMQNFYYFKNYEH